jgi:hypothetical protein
VARVFGEIQGVESGQLFASPDSCGLIRTFKLERPVFGGVTSRSVV